MQTKIKNIFISILLAGQIFVPAFAFASLSPVPTNDSGSTVDNALFNAKFGAAKAVYEGTCLNPLNLFEATHAGSSLGLNGMSLISGGAGKLGLATAQVNAYESFIACAQLSISSFNGAPLASGGILGGIDAPNLYTANIKQTYVDQINATIQTYKTKLQSALAAQSNASQGFWKTLVFNILIQTSKGVADALVAKLVNNYKIANVKQYVDSVATLMYDNQYLRDNFPDAQGQMMARAILNQPELRYQIQPGIYLAADAALGFTPATLSPSDPNFYQKMAMVGSPSANPYYLQSIYTSNVDQAHAQAMLQAQNQVAQSQGYKTPVTCAGSLVQQQQIDFQVKAASDRLANRQALLASLQNAGPSVNQSDLAKAQADYNNAVIAWNNIPYSVTGRGSVSNLQQGGGNNTEGTIAINMCEAIASPATLINKGIDEAFHAVGINMAQYNDNNLPSFISLIGQVASQIGSSLIFGGTSAASGSFFVNENRLAAGAVTAVNQVEASKYATTTLNSVTFTAVQNQGVANSYNLIWNVDPGSVPGADHVTILGDGVPTGLGNQPLSSYQSITTARGGNYTLTIYDVNNNILGSRIITITIAPPTRLSAAFFPGSPQVAGAYTDKPPLLTRGPSPTISLRGQ